MIKVDIKLLPESERYMSSLSDRAMKGLAKSLIDAMLFAEAQAKLIFREGGPVLPAPGPLVARTGYLRMSIRSGTERLVGWIGTRTPYGAIHELGLGKMPKRPFLGPSFEGKNLDRIRDILINGMVKEF